MSKVWEEEWRQGEGYPNDVFGEAGVLFEGALDCPAGQEADGEARAKLAAAAPEMVRMLLELEWEGDNEGRGLCPSCRRHSPIPATTESVVEHEWTKGGLREWTREQVRPGVGGHASDCRLAAVLCKAGVLK